MKNTNFLWLLFCLFSLGMSSNLQAQDQAQMTAAVNTALNAFWGTDNHSITTDGEAGQNSLKGKGNFFDVENVTYEAIFANNSSSKIRKLIANFPQNASMTNGISKTIFKKDLSAIIPAAYLNGIGFKSVVINFQGSNNAAKDINLTLTAGSAVDIININGVTINDVLNLAGMNLQDVVFTIGATDLGLKPNLTVGLGADVDANGIDVAVRGSVSTDIEESEIVISISNVTLNNVMNNLTGGQGLDLLPLPTSIKNAKLGSGKIKIKPLKKHFNVMAKATINDIEIGDLDIIIGKAKPQDDEEEESPDEEAGEEVVDNAKDALENKDSQDLGNGWQVAKPSGNGSSSNIVIGDHRSNTQLQANQAGSAVMASIEAAKEDVEQANPQTNKSTAGGLDFLVGFSVNLNAFDLAKIHPSLKKIEDWKAYIPDGVVAFVISSYKGNDTETNLPALVSMGEAKVKQGLNIIAGFDMPSSVKNAVGLKSGVLKGQLNPLTGNIYLEAAVNSDLQFLVGKDAAIMSGQATPYVIDPGFLGLIGDPNYVRLASFKRLSIGIAPLAGFQISIKGMMDVYLNGPSKAPLQFYVMGYYEAPATVGFGLALMGEWNNPLKIYTDLFPELDILEGLKVGNLAFQIGADFGTASGIPIPEAFAAGLLGFNGLQGEAAVSIDVNTPQKSMLQADMKNLTAWKVLQAFTPSAYKSQLNSKIPNLAKSMLQTGLKNAHLKIVPVTIVQQLTGVAYEAGLGIGGDIEIAGWDAGMVFSLDQNGLLAKGYLDPIDINVQGQKIFEFTSKNDTKKGPQAILNLTVNNLISTTEPFILLDGKAGFFGGVSSGALMKLDGEEFVLESRSRILNKFYGDFKLRGPGFKNLNDLHLSVDMEQSIMDDIARKVENLSDGLANVTNSAFNVTKVHFEGNLGVNDGVGFDFTIEGKIAGQQIKVNIPNVKITPSLVDDIANKVFDETKDIFLNAFGQVLDVVINVGEDIQNFSTSFASNFKNTFFSLVSDIGSFIEDPVGWFSGGGSSNTTTFYRAPNTVPVTHIVNRNSHLAIVWDASLRTNPATEAFWALLPYKDKQTNKYYCLLYNVSRNYYLSYNTTTNRFEKPSQPTTAALWDYEETSGGFFNLKHKKTGKFLAVGGANNSLRLSDAATTLDKSLIDWTGINTDYLLPKDILAGKAKIVAIVYSDKNYSGRKAYLRNKGYSKEAFANMFPPKEMESIKVIPGYTVILEDWYSGYSNYEHIFSDWKDLELADFSRTATSAICRPYSEDKDEIIATVFEEEDFGGARRNYVRERLNLTKYFNDKYRSLRLTNGYRGELFKDDSNGSQSIWVNQTTSSQNLPWSHFTALKGTYLHPYVRDGFYEIKAKHSNLILTPNNHGTANGTELIQWNDENNNSQDFQFEPAENGAFFIKNRKSGKYLEVLNGTVQNGYDNIRLNAKRNSNAQKFSVLPVNNENKEFYIASKLSPSYVLTIAHGNGNKGAKLGLWYNYFKEHQKFVLVEQ